MENKTTEVATVSPKGLQAAPSWTPDQVELIKSTVAKGATDDELKLFLYASKRTGLDPLTKQIHFVKRWDAALQREVGAIQTGIDGYRAIAERTGTLAGIEDVKYEMDAETGKPSRATVTVYRLVEGEPRPFTATAWWSEYAARKKSGGYTAMWERMPRLMLGKCAEALALRKAFPNDLSGIYTAEEMQQAGEENAPAPAPQLPKPDPVLILKNSITNKLRRLETDPRPQTVAQIVHDLTGLELAEANYQEIDSRLAILVEERAQGNE